jgi:hypothetical protein
MIFSYNDFACTKDYFPRYFNVLWAVDKESYLKMEKEYDKEGNCVSSALESIMHRVPRRYFLKMNSAQLDAIAYSEYVFPTYRFILPDAIIDDWLSIMDPHKKYCRDHSLHQPLTAYIVAKLLGYGDPANAFKLKGGDLLSTCAEFMISSPKTAYLRDYFHTLYPDYYKIPECIHLKLARDIFYETAVISALFHDIGYPWQYINRLDGGVLAADFRQSADTTVQSKGILDMIENRLLIYPFYGYSMISKSHPISTWQEKMLKLFDRSLHKTHGFPGSLAFTYLQDKTRSFPTDTSFNEAVCRFIYDWAAVGIMMHDMPKIYKGGGRKPENPFLRVSFDTDPLSCLIATADVLEDFHRPTAKFLKPETNDITVKYEYPCKQTNVELVVDTLKVSYLYSDKSQAAQNKRFRTTEIDDYYNPKQGFVDVSSLGIKEVECYCI